MKKIALLGLGAMGSRIGQNLLKAGFEVSVYNRTVGKTISFEQAGAKVAATPRLAVLNADVVLSLTRDDDSSKAIWETPETGAIHGLKSGAVAIESSTLRPMWTEVLAERIARQHAHFLEAPVVGSRPQAEAGQLIFLVGGESAVLEQVRPVLQSIGSAVHHVGSVGQASAMKLAVNALFGIQVAAVAELLAALKTNGLAIESAAAILAELPVTSPAINGALHSMVQQNFAPMFPIDLVEKDFGYAMSLGQSQMPSTRTALEVYRAAKAAGLGDRNITSVAKLYQ